MLKIMFGLFQIPKIEPMILQPLHKVRMNISSFNKSHFLTFIDFF